MKKFFRVLIALSFVFVQNITPVFAEGSTTGDVREVNNASQFLDALNSQSVYEIRLVNDIVISYDDTNNISKSFIVVNADKKIVGNNKTISFEGLMPNRHFGVFDFRGDTEISDLTIRAPHKADPEDENKDQYTPTVLSFGGKDKTVVVNNVTVRTAQDSNNLQVAVAVSTTNGNVTFDGLFIDGGRLFFNTPNTGKVTLKNSVISQANVSFKEKSGSDEILTFPNLGENRDYFAYMNEVDLTLSNTRLYVNEAKGKLPEKLVNFLNQLDPNALQDIKDATPTSKNSVLVKSGQGFTQSLKSSTVNNIVLGNDITDLSYDSEGTLFSVNHDVTIDGNENTLAFGKACVMPAKGVPVFDFSSNTTIKNLILFAPNKMDKATDRKEFTPTLFSFKGNDVSVNLENVTLNVANGSLNPQIAVYIYAKGNSKFTFDGVSIPSGRLYVAQSAAGSLEMTNSIISQENVMTHDDNLSDEILTLNSETFKIHGVKSRFVVNVRNVNTQTYLVNFLMDFLKETGIDLEISLNGLANFEKDTVQVNVGDRISLQSIHTLFGLVDGPNNTTQWSNVKVESNDVDNGYLVTTKAGNIKISVDYGFEVNGAFHTVQTFTFTLIVKSPQEPEVPTIDTEIVGDENISEEVNVDKIEVQFDESQFTSAVKRFEFGLPTITNSQQENIETQMLALLDGKYQAQQLIVLSIRPIGENGQKLQVVNGNVEITIPVPTSLDPKGSFAVFHVSEDGTLELLEHTVNNGFITFKATSFSNFVVANVESVVEETPVEPEVPTTPVVPETPTQPETSKPDDSKNLPGAGLLNLSMIGFSMTGCGLLTLFEAHRKKRK